MKFELFYNAQLTIFFFSRNQPTPVQQA